jgi:hypothetical protein
VVLAVFSPYSVLLLSSVTLSVFSFPVPSSMDRWHQGMIRMMNYVPFYSIFYSIYSIRRATTLSPSLSHVTYLLCAVQCSVRFSRRCTIRGSTRKAQWEPSLCVWCSYASVKGYMALQFGWGDAVTTQVLRAIFDTTSQCFVFFISVPSLFLVAMLFFCSMTLVYIMY